MPSPFPGIDPHLESRWGDVHLSLITYARDAIQPTLPRDLRARLQERIVDGAEPADVVDSFVPKLFSSRELRPSLVPLGSAAVVWFSWPGVKQHADRSGGGFQLAVEAGQRQAASNRQLQVGGVVGAGEVDRVGLGPRRSFVIDDDW